MKALVTSGLAAVSGSVLIGLASASPSRADDYVVISAITGCSIDKPGHVAIGFFSSAKGDGTDLKAEGTVAVWKDRPPVKMNTQFDKNFLYRSNNGGCGSIASRWAKVSRKRRLWIQNSIATETGTGCRVYSEIAGTAVNFARKRAGKDDGACSCVNFGTTVWRHVTADRERWLLAYTPTKIYNEIYRANGNKTWGWLDNGILWQ